MLFLQPNLELNPASFEILFGFVGPQSRRGHSIGQNLSAGRACTKRNGHSSWGRRGGGGGNVSVRSDIIRLRNYGNRFGELSTCKLMAQSALR